MNSSSLSLLLKLSFFFRACRDDIADQKVIYRAKMGEVEEEITGTVRQKRYILHLFYSRIKGALRRCVKGNND